MQESRDQSLVELLGPGRRVGRTIGLATLIVLGSASPIFAAEPGTEQAPPGDERPATKATRSASTILLLDCIRTTFRQNVALRSASDDVAIAGTHPEVANASVEQLAALLKQSRSFHNGLVSQDDVHVPSSRCCLRSRAIAASQRSLESRGSCPGALASSYAHWMLERGERTSWSPLLTVANWGVWDWGATGSAVFAARLRAHQPLLARSEVADQIRLEVRCAFVNASTNCRNGE
jgi:hypothetical protein